MIPNTTAATALAINDRVIIGTFAHRHTGTIMASQIYRGRQLVTVWADAVYPGPSNLGNGPGVQHYHRSRIGAFVRVKQSPSGAWHQYHNTRLIF